MISTARRQPGLKFWLLMVLLILIASVISMISGPMTDPPRWVVTGLRLPRLVLAILTGAALSVSGCVLQSILRNDLATPYTLGISAGAGVVAGRVD